MLNNETKRQRGGREGGEGCGETGVKGGMNDVMEGGGRRGWRNELGQRSRHPHFRMRAN